LLGVHDEEATSEVARLGLEQVEKVLVVLDLSGVSSKVVSFTALLVALKTLGGYKREEK